MNDYKNRSFKVDEGLHQTMKLIEKWTITDEESERIKYEDHIVEAYKKSLRFDMQSSSMLDNFLLDQGCVEYRVRLIKKIIESSLVGKVAFLPRLLQLQFENQLIPLSQLRNRIYEYNQCFIPTRLSIMVELNILLKLDYEENQERCEELRKLVSEEGRNDGY